MLIGLVSCCKKKRSTPMAASKLYTEITFYKSLLYAKLYCDDYVILSGKHGVVNPDQVIAHYDLDLRKQSPAYVKRWALRVRMVLNKRFPRAGFVAMVSGPYLKALEGLPYVHKEIK